MCTSLKLKYKDNYVFGRNLDLEYHFGEGIVALNVSYNLTFKFLPTVTLKERIMGVGNLMDNYPLFAEAMNESGLCIAGLNYPKNAWYSDNEVKGKVNIAPYEIIPYILVNAKNVDEVKELVKTLNIVAKPFKEGLPLSYLHYLVSDKDKSIVIEPDKDGIKVYDNPYEVLTNNPSFPFHLENVKQYGNLSNKYHVNNLTNKTDLTPFCIGLNAHGLPGDSSSPSRFIKTLYLKERMEEVLTDDDSLVKEAFHIFENVAVIKGESLTQEGKSELTIYTSVLDPVNFIYYYKTYDEITISKVEGKDIVFTKENTYYSKL